MSKNLFDKIWDLHTVATLPSGQTQLYIGLHLIHEVTSPQAFAMIKERGLKVLRPDRTFVIGIQWHPEFTVTDKAARALLRELIQQADAYRTAHGP